MRGHLRIVVWLWVALVALVAPMSVSADVSDPLVVESDVCATVDIPSSNAGHSVAVQATSWQGSSYRYILTFVNLTPWPLSSVYVLDRYLPEDPSEPEKNSAWFPERIEPGFSASTVLTFPEGAIEGACHQLEISLADGLGFVLMDCSSPNATTFWNVPLSAELEAFLAKPLLTAAAPSGASRLGLHITRNDDPRIMGFVRDSKPAVIAAVGDLGWLADVKSASPETITVGRFIEGDQSFTGAPAERARAFVAEHQDRYLANPGVDYWLGWNEPVIDEIWQAEWYAAFEAERIRAMAQLGLKVAIGNFSAGTPEASEFAAFLPAISVAKEFGAIMALHEYSAPTMKEGVGAGIPGLDAQASCGSLTLRYRYFYDYYLRAHDLVIPLVVTEAGIDGGVLREQSAGKAGWRDFYVEPYADAPIDTFSQPYLDQLAWYDDELRRDSYVLGFAIFNAGEREGKWQSFDVTDMLSQFAEMMKTKVRVEPRPIVDLRPEPLPDS